MNAVERAEMFDRALKLNWVDRAELRARKAGRAFMSSAWAPPVIVVGAVVALDRSMATVEALIP